MAAKNTSEFTFIIEGSFQANGDAVDVILELRSIIEQMQGFGGVSVAKIVYPATHTEDLI